MSDKSLQNISQAELALNNATDIEDIVNLRAFGRTLEVFLEAQERKEEAQQAKIFQLKAQIKAGKWLDENVQQGGHNKAKSEDVTLLPEGITRNESSRWQKQYRAGLSRLETYIANCKDKEEEITEAGFMRFISVHIGENTGEYEWYTPKVYIDAARYVMGSIDVDPASSHTANEKLVMATKYYTFEDNGLEQPWEGNIWMNPPYAQPLVTQFTKALVDKWDSGEIQQACVLVNNATETGWYQPMMDRASAICFVRGRIIFLDKDLQIRPGSPLQGQTCLYFGGNVDKFTTAFGELGKVLYAK